MHIRSKNCELDFSWCEFDTSGLNEEQKEFIIFKLNEFMDLIEEIICSDTVDTETIQTILRTILKHSRKALYYFNGYDNGYDDLGEEDIE